MRAVRWVLLGGGGLLLAGVVVWVVGSILPVEHRATLTRTIGADVETVWARIDRVDAWAGWRDAEVEVLADGSVRVREAGETLTYSVERPASRVLVTRITSTDLPFGGAWRWSAEATGDGATAVTIVEEGEVYDPFFRFMSRFVFGHRSSMRRVLDALEASFASDD